MIEKFYISCENSDEYRLKKMKLKKISIHSSKLHLKMDEI